MTSQPTLRELSVCYRSLSVLVGAGVHIVRALRVVATQANDLALKNSLEKVVGKVETGWPLSKAVEGEVGFSPLGRGLIAVGEQTGALHRVLDRLATMTERSQQTRYQLQSALVYPVVVFVLCLLLLVFLPGLVFKDLLVVLSDLGAELPLATRLLMLLSGLTSPPALLVIGLLLVLAFRSFRPSAEFFGRIEPALMKAPGLGFALSASLTAEFTAALCVCYQAGVPILQALDLCGGVTWSPHLARQVKAARKEMEGGATLSEALGSMGVFRPWTLHLITAGEEAGRVPLALDRVARASQEELEDALDLATQVLQPLMLVVIGAIVGFVVIATMSPMLKLVEHL